MSRWQWSAGAWAPAPGTRDLSDAGPPEAGAPAPGPRDRPDADPLVADSWLVADGRVRGWELHAARFAASAAACGADRVQAAAALAAIPPTLPAEGRWFPRVELTAGGDLVLRLRPAPSREASVVAWAADVPDPRRSPRIKGPDLARLGGLRERAAAHGAGEAVIRDGDGRLVEGAWSSLLWWDGATLCALDESAPILPGVTRALLLGLAADENVPVARRRPRPEDLAGKEAWLVNAAHGVRAVASWAGGPPAGPAARAASWQARLDALAAPWGTPRRAPAGGEGE